MTSVFKFVADIQSILPIRCFGSQSVNVVAHRPYGLRIKFYTNASTSPRPAPFDGLDGSRDYISSEGAQQPLSISQIDVQEAVASRSPIFRTARVLRSHRGLSQPWRSIYQADPDHADPDQIDGPRPRRNHFGKARKSSSSLSLILADYVRNEIQGRELLSASCGDPTELRMEKNDRQVEIQLCLRKRGYEIGDLPKWAEISQSETSTGAVSSLMAQWKQRGHSELRPSVPLFIFRAVLRRKDHNAQSFKSLLQYARLFFGCENRDASEDLSAGKPLNQALGVDKPNGRYSGSQVDGRNFGPLIEDLIAQARRVWPAGLEPIAEMAMQNRMMPTIATLTQRQAIYWTSACNHILQLLAYPSITHPVISMRFHQRAQLRVLGKMNSFQPALGITRLGYRATAAVQLAHRKTSSEKEWDEMKAKSWPPWKKEKMGIDFDKTIEDGMSRATHVLMQSVESGYRPQTWEKAAGILAGWDTDRSPTIQRRALLTPLSTQRPMRHQQTKCSNHNADEESIWASRVAATRTLDEAWAQFLSYQAQIQPVTSRVYDIMLEKMLLYKRWLRSKQSHDGHEAIAHQAGDDLQPLAPPTSPQDGTFVSAVIPDIRDFVKSMIDAGVQPSMKFRILLIHHQEPGRPLDFLLPGVLPQTLVRAFLDVRMPPQEAKLAIQKTHDGLFAAIIRMLCRASIKQDSLRYATLDRTMSLEVSLPFCHAYNLISRVKPRTRPAWYNILNHVEKVSEANLCKFSMNKSDGIGKIRWDFGMRIMREMMATGVDMDLAGLLLLSRNFERAFLEHKTRRPDLQLTALHTSDLDTPSKPGELSTLSQPWFLDATEEIKELFQTIVGRNLLFQKPQVEGFDIPPLPAPADDVCKATTFELLAIPSSADLHRMIRVLGLVADYDGLKNLLTWMGEEHREIQALAMELTNGQRMMRTSLTAARVFLEGSWSQCDMINHNALDTQNDSESRAPSHIITEARDVVEAVRSWGGWPSDAEVDDYCEKGQIRARDRSKAIYRDDGY